MARSLTRSHSLSRAAAGALALCLALAAPFAVRAGEEAVSIELKSGERINGALLDFGERVYRVRVGGVVREVREEDVRSLRFGAAPPTGGGAREAEGPLSAEDVLPHGSPKGIRIEEALTQRYPREKAQSLIREAAAKLRAEGQHAGQLEESAEGLDGLARVRYVEPTGRDSSLDVEVYLYKTTADAMQARSGLLPELRRRGAKRSEDHPQTLTCEIITCRNLIVAMHDLNASGFARASLRDSIVGNLERLAPGEMRTESPSVRKRPFGRNQLALPEIWLPAGLRDTLQHMPLGTKLRDGLPKGETITAVFADNVATRVGGSQFRTEHGRGTATLALYRTPLGAGGKFGTLDPAALSRFRTYWLAPAVLVGLLVEGDVPDETVRFLERFVESELARASDTEGARRHTPLSRIDFASLFPLAADVPGFDDPRFRIAGEEWVKEERAGKANDPDSDEKRALIGLVNVGSAKYGDQLRESVSVRLWLFDSAATAAAALPVVRSATVGKPSMFPRITDVACGGPVLYTFEDDFVMPMAADALRRALDAKILAATGATVTAERLSSEIAQFGDDAIEVSSAWLPPGVRLLDRHNTSKSTPAGSSGRSRCWYRVGERGDLEVRAFRGPERARMRGDIRRSGFPDALPERAEWEAPDAQLTLVIAASGDVPAEIVGWFARNIEAAQARCKDTKGARRVK